VEGTQTKQRESYPKRQRKESQYPTRLARKYRTRAAYGKERKKRKENKANQGGLLG